MCCKRHIMRNLMLLGLLVSSTALAAPTFRPKNGHTVRVVLGEKKERGFGVKHAHGEWRVELGQTHAAMAEVVDVTAGTPGSKWEVSVESGALRLDQRFIAGHAYRVELRHGTQSLGSTLVYLYPPKAAAKQQVTFADDDSGADGEIATLPKPVL
jgi:hypothetical protein